MALHTTSAKFDGSLPKAVCLYQLEPSHCKVSYFSAEDCNVIDLEYLQCIIICSASSERYKPVLSYVTITKEDLGLFERGGQDLVGHRQVRGSSQKLEHFL